MRPQPRSLSNVNIMLNSQPYDITVKSLFMMHSYLCLSEKEKFMETAKDILEDLSYSIVDFKNLLGVDIKEFAELKAFTPERLRTFVDEQKKQLLGNVKFVPKAIRDSFEAQFDKTYNEALPLVAATQKQLRELAGMKVEPTIADGHVTADKKTLEKRATEFATVHFTEEQMRYATLIADAAKAMKDVVDFEKFQGFPHTNLEQRLQPLGYKFDEAVFFGLIAERL